MLRKGAQLTPRLARLASSFEASTSAIAIKSNTYATAPLHTVFSAAPSRSGAPATTAAVVGSPHVPPHAYLRQARAASAAAGSQAAAQNGLVVSDRAVERLKQLKAKAGGAQVFLRLAVEGGGCSGFQYEFALEEEGPKPKDAVFESEGVTVMCDDVSMEFLKGATVDFESDLMRSAFVVHDNPNASAACGCGSSFAAK